MDSSDDDFLPDPDRPRKEKKPPNPQAKCGQKRKLDQDSTKGKCFFIHLKSDIGFILAGKERVRQCRDRKSEEEKASLREKDRLRKAKRRRQMTNQEGEAQKEIRRRKRAHLTDEEKDVEKEKDRKRKADKVAERKEREDFEKREERLRHWDEMKEMDRKRKRKVRRKMTQVEHEFACVEQLIRRRKAREDRNEEEHLLDNLKAKKGMKYFKKFGRIKDYKASRYYNKYTDLEIWKIFRDLGYEYEEILEEKRPDILVSLNKARDEEMDARKKVYVSIEEKEKMEKEAFKKAKEAAIKEGKFRKSPILKLDQVCVNGNWYDVEDDPDEKKGEWVYNAGFYWWVGEGEPEPVDYPDFNDMQPVTEEDEQRSKEQEKEWLIDAMERMKEEKREYMRNYNEKKKKALLEPIILPENGEKCEYEKLRDKNIAELKKKRKELFMD